MTHHKAITEAIAALEKLYKEGCEQKDDYYVCYCYEQIEPILTKLKALRDT